MRFVYCRILFCPYAAATNVFCLCCFLYHFECTENILKFCTLKSDKMAYANSIDPDLTAPEGAV